MQKRASEVPELEAKLAADKAYQAVWAGPRSDLNSFLSFVSQLVAVGYTPKPLADVLKAKKLEDAAIKLYLIFVRIGKFPDGFTQKFTAHLDVTKGEAHAGTWSAFNKDGPYHDYTALVAWLRLEDAGALREMLSAQAGGGPFRWDGWDEKKPPQRLWLVDEQAALDRLALLTKLTAEERARREVVQARAQKIAAAKAAIAAAAKTTPAELFYAYKRNEVAADEKYKGKQLLVIGTIASVDKDPFGNIVVRLASPNELMPVDSKLEDTEKDKAVKLGAGDQVSVLCKGNGVVLGRPQLEDCTIQ